MNRTMTLFLTAGMVLAFSVLFSVGYVVRCNNRAIELENKFKASRQKVEAVFDNVWRIIEGKASVAVEYKAGIVEVIKAQTAGRTGGDIVKMVQEAVPGLDPSVYRDVGNAIEGQRTTFLNAQTEILAIKQEHDNLRLQFPSNLIAGSRPELIYNVVSSARTKQAIESGRDESDPDPFRARNAGTGSGK